MAHVRADGDRALRPLCVSHGGLKAPSDGADLIPPFPLPPAPVIALLLSYLLHSTSGPQTSGRCLAGLGKDGKLRPASDPLHEPAQSLCFTLFETLLGTQGGSGCLPSGSSV